jgi:DNA-binding MarR family transcriptional regulator
MDKFNAVIHQPARLQIMAALVAMGPQDHVNFSYLRDALHVSDGNLGAHLLKLEEAGYLVQEKTFVARKPCTYIQATEMGRAAFHAHVAALRKLLDQNGTEDEQS